ncbi:hypothetical protein DYB32_003961 [Aphanomyces invadans]|uniref:Uncharacterized protein n=1 Tax=Aphanomyces invadans TaxID=157072 RepID=A0A418AZ37_9STRA|nr:hypothetical protein DYB32_003961 [Aphanomyces invadans]
MSTSTILAIVCGVVACGAIGGALLMAILRTRPRYFDSDDDIFQDDPRPIPATLHAANSLVDGWTGTYARPSGVCSEPAILASTRSDVELAILSFQSELEAVLGSIRSDNGANTAMSSIRSSGSARSNGVGIAIRVPSLLDVNPDVFAQNPQLRLSISQCRKDVLQLYLGHESPL